MYSIGLPVVSTKFMIEDAEHEYAIGDSISVTVDRGFKPAEVITGTVAAIELQRTVVDDNPDQKVLDNVPICRYIPPVCAQVEDSSITFEVYAILVKVETPVEPEPDDGPQTIVTYERVLTEQILALA